MSRFKASHVIDELRSFENDYNDELEAYVGVESVTYDNNGDAVAVVVITPVVQVEDDDDEFRVDESQAERFRVKVNRL